MRAATALVLAALLMPIAAAADDDPSAPPAGITPSAITLKRLLALHDTAVGRLKPGTPKTRSESWTYTEAELTGTQTFVSSGKDYRENISLGPFQSSDGELAGKSWEHNRNGYTRPISGIHKRDDADEYALQHALVKDSGVILLGEVTAPSHAYVVKVDPKGGRVEYVFFDASTYLITREERSVEGLREVETYDDFRTTQGVKLAWHMHRSNGLANDESDWQMQSLQIGGPVDPAKLAIPAGSDPVALTGSPVTLPAKLSGDRVILTVEIGTHKVNLQLDSGASGILLNRDVADATGVRSFGSKTAVTAGKYREADALVPKLDFGVASMQNVAIETAPYAELTYDGSPVAGLIGYDFIAGSVVHIDYLNGTVQAIAPKTFTPPAGAVALPIRLDDGVPIVTARIGSAAGDHFIVDTGADRSMIFSGFATEHQADVADQGMGEEMTASFPFPSKILGVGGKVAVRPVQVPSLSLGTISLPKWLFDVSQDAPSFEGDDYDGLIGQDVLRYFDVYFDYAHEKMYLVPNDRYKQRFG